MDYVTRSEWGARPPKQAYTPLPAASTGIAVHHEGDGLNPPLDCAAKMRSTQRYHQDSKGWNDIAYSWAVGCGRIWEGRGWGVIDGADTGQGRLMHSVVWLGDSSVAKPSDADLAAINTVIAEQANHGAPTVVGHRDINPTDCPGSNLYAWLQSGRPTNAPPLIESPVLEDDMTTIFVRGQDRGEVIQCTGGMVPVVFVPSEDYLKNTAYMIRSTGGTIVSGEGFVDQVGVPVRIVSNDYADELLRLVRS